MLQVVKFMIAVPTLSKVLVTYNAGGGLQKGKGGGNSRRNKKGELSTQEPDVIAILKVGAKSLHPLKRHSFTLF